MQLKHNEILIVDDNPENLRVLNEMLIKQGYRVRAAKNGKQALSSIEISEPDLLLLDIHMPEMDGFELCKIIKDRSEYEKLPVIFISALSDTFNKVQAFEAGAVDYITKPFDVEEVKVRVRTHLFLRSCLFKIDELNKELEIRTKEIERLKSKDHN